MLTKKNFFQTMAENLKPRVLESAIERNATQIPCIEEGVTEHELDCERMAIWNEFINTPKEYPYARRCLVSLMRKRGHHEIACEMQRML